MSDTDGAFGSGLGFDPTPGAGAPLDLSPQGPGASGADVPSQASGSEGPSFGDRLRDILPGPHYRAPDPQQSALDQTADTLQQRIERANQIAANPLLQFFNPEGVTAARNFVPAATEQLQKIRTQKAQMQANRTQAATLGLDPGEVPDEATQADRVQVAQSKALQGNLQVFRGLQAVDPKSAEAIQDQVHNVVAGHLTNAQLAFDSLAGMQNQGQYVAKLDQLRKSGALSDLEALGLKVPPSFDAFNANKAGEAQALREARIGVDTIRQKLEERNTYQPMEKKEAETYHGRLTTVYGDQVTNGTWGRNGASGTRGLIVNGMADPRELGKSFTLATPEQRKAVKEEFDGAVPKEDVEKYRAFNRTYQMATQDAKGKPMPDGKLNTNPNVQQGVSEGLAAMLRGGSGGANVGLLKIELAKRGWAQGAIDGLVSNYAGAMNTLFANADKPYLSQQTQKQIRDVMDVLKTYNDSNINDRAGTIAQRAGALGLDTAALGLGKNEATGAIGDAIEAGRRAQVERMMPNHQAIGGGDGVLQLGAQRPGAGAVTPPTGTTPTNQLPGAQPLQTPVQQATQPQQPAAPQPPVPPTPSGGSPPPAAPNQPVQASQPPNGSGPAGGGAPPTAPQPVQVAGQQVSVPLPQGASANYATRTQQIETPKSKDPWTATTTGTSASGAFQFTDATWKENAPAGSPARAKDATPAQQAEAFATFTKKNADALTAAKLPVNDTTLYAAHNLGAAGATKLLTADPNDDARTVVGARAAGNNPLFFRGKPTVATVLQRYQAEVNKEPPKLPGTPDDKEPGIMERAAATLEGTGATQRVGGFHRARQEGDGLSRNERMRQAGQVLTENAPAVGSTLGAGIGFVTPVPGGMAAGGAIGGGAGQALKDYLQGNQQSPTEIIKQAALGGVLGVMPEARPVAGAAARVLGSGAVKAGADAVENGVGPSNVDAAVQGGGEALGGEMFGRALGMVGHKVYSMFAPDAKAAVRTAAKTYAEASETLKTEAPKIPGANGAAAAANPKYEAAEAALAKSEATLKDAGLKPEEAAYAHRVSSEGVPKQEAAVSRPGEIEKQDVSKGYDQLRQEVADKGVGAPKASPKLPDGPRAAVESKQVSAAHAELADHVEAAITAPAPSWAAKWQQLQDARSQLLTAERDALTSTAPGRSKTAADMRTLADTVRKQQEKAANFVFGPKDGPEFMKRLKVLDTRYRNLMEATNGGDLAKAATLKGEAGRDADRKFTAFAHDDAQALAAWRAMRGTKGDAFEATVPWTVAAEGIPRVGKVVKLAKLGGMLREWARERTAGSPVRFEDMAKLPHDDTGRRVRDIAGTVAQRAAVQGDVLGGAPQQ